MNGEYDHRSLNPLYRTLHVYLTIHGHFPPEIMTDIDVPNFGQTIALVGQVGLYVTRILLSFI